MIDLKKHHAEQDLLHKLLMTWDTQDLLDCFDYISKDELVDLLLDNDLLGEDRDAFLEEAQEKYGNQE